MRIGKLKKLGIGVVAAATMAGGAALAAPAVAMADAPTIAVEQDGNDVTVTTTDENTSGITACMPVLVSGETALQLLVAYQAGDYGTIADLLVNGDHVQYGEIASHVTVFGTEILPNPSVTEWTPANGVYVLVGGCSELSLHAIKDLVTGGPGALLANLGDDITVRPLIVPNGIGSIEPALNFGSLLLESGDALSALSSDGLLTGLLGAGTGS
ncbi:hypothetical protein [Tomitella cavernea]|uniref:Secreted protein n=1 Tax=Tomitella cavernea TaxID=1387982 RepID=A0ABP9D412_9ACTN|nr:hypothetical protein [Tomitella cavernea]